LRWHAVTRGGNAVVVAGLVGSTSGASATMIDITPSSMDAWKFNTRDSIGISTTTRPDTAGWWPGRSAALGVGSANIGTGDGTSGGDGASELRNTDFAGTLIASITALSYSTYVTQTTGNNSLSRTDDQFQRRVHR